MKTFLEKILFPDVTVVKAKLSYKISGKTIVITGASYGIGKQLALLFSQYKVHLVLIARTTEKLEAISNTVISNGSDCDIITADLYKESEVERVIEKLLKLPSGIDIFISNAGKSIMRPLANSLDRYHDFTRTNSLNYLAPVRILLSITPLLATRNGMVINVSAINVLLLPAPKWAAYQASKTAFDQWFRANLAEWKAMGIEAKSIYLPLVKTKMIAPNLYYKNYPAMQPQQAAVRIANLICSYNNNSKPWWALFLQTGSFFGRTIWEKASLHYLNKRNENNL